MEFIKKNKFTIIAIAVFLVFIILLVQVKNVFFPNAGNAVYGDRLNGINEVKITKNIKNKIIDNLESDSGITKATVTLNGKIINIIIIANDDVSVETAKTYAPKAFENLDEGQKAYYDIQVYVKKNSEATNFPIIGYKQNNSDTFSWTKDRA